jgi:ABC-2 type transport system ATP-binding protein
VVLFDGLFGPEMLEYPGLQRRMDRGVIRQRT